MGACLRKWSFCCLVLFAKLRHMMAAILSSSQDYQIAVSHLHWTKSSLFFSAAKSSKIRKLLGTWWNLDFANTQIVILVLSHMENKCDGKEGNWKWKLNFSFAISKRDVCQNCRSSIFYAKSPSNSLKNNESKFQVIICIIKKCYKHLKWTESEAVATLGDSIHRFSPI